MTKQIRVALDIEVEKGSAEEIAKAVFEERKAVGNFIAHTIIPSTDAGDGAKVTVLAGGSHVHDTQDIGYCEMCDKYSRKQTLISVES